MQLDMFTCEEITALKEDILKVKKSSEQVRKGLFARHTALEKYITELCERLEEQEREIYKLKQKIQSENCNPYLERVV